MEINSIALPPLGCGQGGLNWKDVKNLINKYLGPLDLLDVYVYESSEIGINNLLGQITNKNLQNEELSKVEGLEIW